MAASVSCAQGCACDWRRDDYSDGLIRLEADQVRDAAATK